MKYNGKELIEMTPEYWDGKTREMLVWDGWDEHTLRKLTLIGYDSMSKNWITSYPYKGWHHCAEIPVEAKEDVMKPLNDNEKEILELKAENEKLKAKIKSLSVERGKMANAVSNAVWKELMERAHKDSSIGIIRLPAGLGFNDISDIVLNKIIDYESEKKLRRMTYNELDNWLEQGKGLIRIGNHHMSNKISYDYEDRNREVNDAYEICGWDEAAWHEPLIEE